MWNLNYTIPSFFVLLILLIYYFIRPRVDSRINRDFLRLLIVTGITMIFDHLSATMNLQHQSYPEAALYAANTLFGMMSIVRNLMFCVFTADALEIPIKRTMMPVRLAIGVLVLSELMMLLNPVTHFVFYFDAAGIHYGIGNYILYAQILFYIFTTFHLLRIRQDLTGRFDYWSVMTYNYMLLIGVTVQYLFPKLYLMNPFCLFAIIVQFISFQNPDKYIYRRTGLFNRDALEEIIREIIVCGKQRKFLGVAIKNFVSIREIYGENQTKHAMDAISSFLLGLSKDYCIYYLLNGQFVIGTPIDCDLAALREKITQAFHAPWGGEDANVFLEVGFFEDNGLWDYDSIAQFRDCLDLAFHRVDRFGVNECLDINSSLRREWEHQVAVKRAIRRAVEHDSVEVLFQPIIDAVDHHLVGAEALSRIIDPKLGMILPDDFIPVAEASGSIAELGEQVYRKACEFLSNGGFELGLEWINVNLSPIQCMDSELPDELMKIAAEYGLSPSDIHLEITEQENVDPELMRQQTIEMTKRGFVFVMDDYGTGYSNIFRIRRLPLINVKMDMSMVHEYFRKQDKLLPLCINMVKGIGFGVTAEGVETAEMAEQLKKLGCDYLQGYYFSKPIPMEEFRNRYLRKDR